MLYALYITNKLECSNFESGCAVQMAKHLKEGWFTVLQLQVQVCTAIKKFNTNILKFKAHLKAKFYWVVLLSDKSIT